MRNLIIFFLFLSLFSCELIHPTDENIGDVVAQVGERKFYKKDLQKMLPKNIQKEDSVLFAKKAINSWAKQELFYQNAQVNLSDEQDEINKLVDKYRQDLLINKYKEALISKNLDTVITASDIQKYYQENKNIFKLNEKLMQFRFIQTNKDIGDLKEIKELFDSSEASDLDSLHNKELEFKAYHLQDTVWVKFNDVAKKIKIFNQINFKKLKTNKLLELEDQEDVYLFKIFKILKRNDTAPKEYVKPTIKQMILHDRKLKEQKNIEKTLLNDAIKNGKFQIYE